MTGTFRTAAALAVIFALAFGTRLAYYASNPHPAEGPWVYGAMAHNIVSDGHWFQVNANAGPHFSLNAPLSPENASERADFYSVAPSEINLKYADAHPRWVPFVFEPVGESVLLAGVWEAIGSQTYLSDVLMKIVLDALAALLIYHIAMRLFRRRRTALLASLLYALYPPIAEVVVSPDRIVWSLDFTIVIFAVYLEAIDSPRPGRWLVACGILAGIGSYFDSGALLLPTALALATVAMVNWRTTLRRALIPTVIAGLLVIPWTIRNYNDYHTFVPLRAGGGMTVWTSLLQIDRIGSTSKEYENFELLHHTHPGLQWLTPAWDSYLGKLALAAIERHPLIYAKTVAHNIWGSTVADVDSEWMHSGTTTPFSYSRGPIAYAIEQPLQLLQVALMPLVFLLAMLSLGLTWGRYKLEHLLLIALALGNALPYLILHMEPRYVVPVAISYLIWIGLGCDLLLERLGSRRRLHDPSSRNPAANRAASKGWA